jgi:CRP/FNR family transcriptional regulator, anaerobic regulatory protein
MSQVLRILQGDAAHAAVQRASWPGRGRSDHSPRRILQAGEHLFQAGDPGNEAFILRTGHLKSYRVYRDGEEQILGMHGPGDVLGFDALIGRPASCSAVALEIASIEVVDLSRMPFDPESRCGNMCHLMEGMYLELQRCSRLLHMDRHPAERRLAEFLLDFTRGERRQGRSPDDLILPFNRRDLARFLGLAPETLSRIFSRFQEQGVLSVHNREIHVLDPPALQSAAGE